MANTTGKKYGGRKKGTPNRTTGDMKAAILEAFERAGGADYLTMLAADEPRTFVTLLAKILPSENINANIDMNDMTQRLQEGRDRVAKLRVVGKD
jgi:hypothetical protein|tara:strand:- start:4833 stop:5117 length:285 start_codon:yes stop_codon:yes gene_type:complete